MKIKVKNSSTINIVNLNIVKTCFINYNNFKKRKYLAFKVVFTLGKYAKYVHNKIHSSTIYVLVYIVVFK